MEKQNHLVSISIPSQNKKKNEPTKNRIEKHFRMISKPDYINPDEVYEDASESTDSDSESNATSSSDNTDGDDASDPPYEAAEEEDDTTDDELDEEPNSNRKRTSSPKSPSKSGTKRPPRHRPAS